MMDVRR